MMAKRIHSLMIVGLGAALQVLAPGASAWADPSSETQRIYRSAYFLGRGDTGIATADNHDAIYYNPAGLAYGKGIYKETILVSPQLEVSHDTRDLIRQVAFEKKTDVGTLREHIGKNQHVGVQNFTGIVLRRAAIGVLLSNQTNLLVAKDPAAGGLETVSADTTTNQVFSFSFADSFWSEEFLVGITAKYVSRSQGALNVNILDAQDVLKDLEQDDVYGTGTGAGADLGMMYRSKDKSPFSLGLTIENVGDTRLKANTKAKVAALKQTLNLGLAWEMTTSFSTFRFLIDMRDLTSNVETNKFKKLHLGGELAIRSFMGLTAGFNQGYPTAGAYINLYFLRLDVGGYANEIGDRIGERPDPRFYLRLAAGF